MKKKFFKIIGCFAVIVLTTGCVKFNSTMDIKKDKSMDFSIIYAIDTSVFGNEDILDEENKKDLTDSGYKVEKYKDGNMSGYTLSLSISNIDLVSDDKSVEYSLSNILEDSKEDKKIFQVKKGLIKNTYTANFKFDSSDSDLSNDTGSDSTSDDLDSWDIEGDSDTNWDNFISSTTSSMDLSFTVNLPYRALSNNATQVSDDSKNLIWSLSNEETENIQFVFELYNYTNLIMIGVIILLIVAGILYLIVFRKKKNTNSTNINGVAENSGINNNSNNNVTNTSISDIGNLDAKSINSSIEQIGNHSTGDIVSSVSFSSEKPIPEMGSPVTTVPFEFPDVIPDNTNTHNSDTMDSSQIGGEEIQADVLANNSNDTQS